LSGPWATTRTVTSGIGFSPGTRNKVPALSQIGIEIGEFVALAGRVAGGRWLARSPRARLDAGKVRGVMREAAGRPKLAVADAVDPGLDLLLQRLRNRRRDPIPLHRRKPVPTAKVDPGLRRESEAGVSS
jgi:hypothetical protein